MDDAKWADSMAHFFEGRIHQEDDGKCQHAADYISRRAHGSLEPPMFRLFGFREMAHHESIHPLPKLSVGALLRCAGAVAQQGTG